MATRELELRVTLPEELAEEADASGLLSPHAVERMLREEIRRRRVQDLFEAADRLAAVELPPLTEDELDAEIEAARAERRSRDARGA